MIPKFQMQDLQKNDQYTLQLETSGHLKRLNLLIKKTRGQTDVFSSQINSIEDIKNHFDDIETFTEYIKDPTHWQLNLEGKSLTIILRSQTKKNKFYQILTINLKFMETKEREQELINLIMDRCNSKIQFKQDEIKSMFETIALCLLQFVKEKKQFKQTKKDIQGLTRRVQTLENLNQQLKQQRQKAQRQLIQFKYLFQKTLKDIQPIFQKIHNQYLSKIIGQVQRVGKKLSQILESSNSIREAIDKKLKQKKQNEINLHKIVQDFGSFLAQSQIMQNLVKKDQEKKKLNSSPKFINYIKINHKDIHNIDNKHNKGFIIKKVQIPIKVTAAIVCDIIRGKQNIEPQCKIRLWKINSTQNTQNIQQKVERQTVYHSDGFGELIKNTAALQDLDLQQNDYLIAQVSNQSQDQFSSIKINLSVKAATNKENSHLCLNANKLPIVNNRRNILRNFEILKF